MSISSRTRRQHQERLAWSDEHTNRVSAWDEEHRRRIGVRNRRRHVTRPDTNIPLAGVNVNGSGPSIDHNAASIAARIPVSDAFREIVATLLESQEGPSFYAFVDTADHALPSWTSVWLPRAEPENQRRRCTPDIGCHCVENEIRRGTDCAVNDVDLHALKEQMTCPVCYGNVTRVLCSCSHMFCFSCVARIMDMETDHGQAPSCPLCRAVLSPVGCLRALSESTGSSDVEVVDK